jgi:hypothetical protein
MAEPCERLVRVEIVKPAHGLTPPTRHDLVKDSRVAVWVVALVAIAWSALNRIAALGTVISPRPRAARRAKTKPIRKAATAAPR